MDALVMALRADPASLSVVRERLRRWLAALGWPGDEVADIVLAANEAVSIAIAHAVAGGLTAEVRVAGRCFAEPDGARRVIIGVAGDGRWQPDPDACGIGLMTVLHTCMDAVEMTSDESSTTVLMTSVAVAPPA